MPPGTCPGGKVNKNTYQLAPASQESAAYGRSWDLKAALCCGPVSQGGLRVDVCLAESPHRVDLLEASLHTCSLYFTVGDRSNHNGDTRGPGEVR